MADHINISDPDAMDAHWRERIYVLLGTNC